MGLKFRMPFARQEDSSIMAAITPEGKQEAENYASGGVEFDVLVTLNEHSPLSISQICHETNLPFNKVRAILNVLVRKGYVKRLGGFEERE